MASFVSYILVALGGALGAVLRYGAVLLIRPHSPNFPLGTLLVNLSGCLVIGLLAPSITGGPMPRENLRLLLMVGILGGYTTFSSFGLETVQLLRDGRAAAAAGYILASNLLGIGAAFLGYLLAERPPAG